MKTNKPNLEEEVLEVMKDYCKKKGYLFSNTQLDFMAQSCYLYFESRGWIGIKYWPAVAMRWVLTNLGKQIKSFGPKINVHKSKSVRDKIMEQENEL